MAVDMSAVTAADTVAEVAANVATNVAAKKELAVQTLNGSNIGWTKGQAAWHV